MASDERCPNAGDDERVLPAFFDPLLRDIAFERDSGQGIPLPILLENVQRRLAEAKAALAQHSVLINIGVMEGYARQITQIQQTLAETFPTASIVTGATAADVIAAAAHHLANRPYSLAELLQRRVAIQPLKQALKDRFYTVSGRRRRPYPLCRRGSTRCGRRQAAWWNTR
ncbi:hypothetical protein SODG_004259 [Sodalis praecaptivus]